MTDRSRRRPRYMIEFDPKSGRTKQSPKDECDINQIMARWTTGRELTHVNFNQGSYGDFSSVTDYVDARNQVQQADEAFLALPSHIRALMDNDPAVLLDFLADPENDADAVELGLKNAPPAPPKTEPEMAPNPGEKPPEPSPE